MDQQQQSDYSQHLAMKMTQDFSMFKKRRFDRSIEVSERDGLYIYKLDYYASHLNLIEDLHEGEIMLGNNLKMTRQFVESHGECKNMFTYHTNLRDITIQEENLKGSFCIVHGYGENSDIHLESAIQYALNGFDVHLIDLRGFGMTGGTRMAGFKIHDLHYDVAVLLRWVNPNLPLFIYGHSMGGLTILSFLINNPQLNISGVILSAPLTGFHPISQVDDTKANLVRIIGHEIEDFVINPKIPTHLICSDKRIFQEFLQNRKMIPFMSLGLIGSMVEYFKDMPLNAQDFKYPVFTMLAEKEFLVNNRDTRKLVVKLGSTDKEIHEFKDAYHELQKEPIKDEVHTKVLQFAAKILGNERVVKKFGVINLKSIRYGPMKKQTPHPLTILKRKLKILIIYLIIGYILSRGYLKGKALATLIWPLYVILKRFFGMK
eukprot:403352255